MMFCRVLKLITREVVICMIDEPEVNYAKKTITIHNPRLIENVKYQNDGMLYESWGIKIWLMFTDVETIKLDTSKILLDVPATEKYEEHYKIFLDTARPEDEGLFDEDEEEEESERFEEESKPERKFH